MPKIEPRVWVPANTKDGRVPKLPVAQSSNSEEGQHSVAPHGRLLNNSVMVNGTEYELESLLKFLVSKVDHSA